MDKTIDFKKCRNLCPLKKKCSETRHMLNFLNTYKNCDLSAEKDAYLHTRVTITLGQGLKAVILKVWPEDHYHSC